MLLELNIKDFAIIDRLSLRLEQGFNVLTGETGAGKSIIIDALGTLRGDRADPTFVRAGTERARVEGVFSISDRPDVVPVLTEYGLWDEEDEMDGGRIWKQRGLCANRKAVEFLLKSGLLIPGEIKPVRIIDELRHGDEKLDGIAELPEPYYTEEELARVRKLLEPAWVRHLATPKPKREVTIEKALSMLRRARKQRPRDFSKPAGAGKGPAVSLPANWLAVLSVAGEAILNHDCTIASTSALQDMLLELESTLKALYDDYPFECRHIPIGFGSDGDIFSIEDRGSRQIDSKVFRLSHDGFTIEHVWENIPLFISDMLSGFYD